jgi:hypothetical protein
MRTTGTTMRQVAFMSYSAHEQKVMNQLNVAWLMSMDLKHENFLAYSLDIQVEDTRDVCQRKYVDMNDFYSYKDEQGTKWWISNAMEVQDLDAFFQCYFHLYDKAA